MSGASGSSERGVADERRWKSWVSPGHPRNPRLRRDTARAVSRENLDLVRSISAPWQRGDFSSADWAHSEIEWVIADGPMPGRWTGVAGMVEGWRDFLSAWDQCRAGGGGVPRARREQVLRAVPLSARGKASRLEVGEI